MLAWIYGVAERVEEEARRDAQYSALARRQAELAPLYDEILVRMDPQEREVLLDHILVREEMLYRLAQLAWKYGTKNP